MSLRGLLFSVLWSPRSSNTKALTTKAATLLYINSLFSSECSLLPGTIPPLGIPAGRFYSFYKFLCSHPESSFDSLVCAYIAACHTCTP